MELNRAQMMKGAPVRYSVCIDFNNEGQLRLSPVPNEQGNWVKAAEVEELVRSLEYWRKLAKIVLKEE